MRLNSVTNTCMHACNSISIKINLTKTKKLKLPISQKKHVNFCTNFFKQQKSISSMFYILCSFLSPLLINSIIPPLNSQHAFKVGWKRNERVCLKIFYETFNIKRREEKKSFANCFFIVITKNIYWLEKSKIKGTQSWTNFCLLASYTTSARKKRANFLLIDFSFSVIFLLRVKFSSFQTLQKQKKSCCVCRIVFSSLKV